MSDLQIEIQVTDAATPVLARLEHRLTDRTDLHAHIAPQVEELTRSYIRAEAPGRHKTAARLGASPTGHLARAASAVESGHDREQAFITIPRSTGLGRAFRDFELTPKGGKKWLTIPAHRSAYGRRAGEFDNLQFVPLGNDLAALVTRTRSDAKWTVIYWLKKEVTIPQDRDLLPSDAAYRAAAEMGAVEYIKILTEGDQT